MTLVHVSPLTEPAYLWVIDRRPARRTLIDSLRVASVRLRPR